MPPLSQPHPLQLAKRDLRRLMESKRQTAAAQTPQASTSLRAQFLQNIILPPNTIIASYHARGSEINPLLLTEALRVRGHVITLPVMNGKKAPLLFRRFETGDDLAPSHFGLFEPLPSAPMLEPDIVLAPLLAFDRHKGRLGYGGGYYDRTLSSLRQRKIIMAIGLAYSAQEVLEIPMGCYDARLDKVVTELQVF